MLKNLVLFSFAALLFVSGVARGDTFCQGYVPVIEVVPSFGHVKRDLSLRAVDVSSPDAWGDMMVSHLAATTQLNSTSNFQVLNRKRDYCVYMSDVTVLYRMEATLRLSNKYPKDSCEYAQVQKHDEKHAALVKEFMAQSVPVIRDHLLKFMKNRSSLVVGSGDEEKAKTNMQLTMNNELAAYARYLNQEHKKLQVQIMDSPEEMRKMFSACPGWQAPVTAPK